MDMREGGKQAAADRETRRMWLVCGLGQLQVTGQLGEQDENPEAGN